MGSPSKTKISIRYEKEGGQETGLVGLVWEAFRKTQKKTKYVKMNQRIL